MPIPSVETEKAGDLAGRSDRVDRAAVIHQVLRGGSIEASIWAKKKSREGRAAIGARILAKVMDNGQLAGRSDFEYRSASREGIVGASQSAAVGRAVEVAV